MIKTWFHMCGLGPQFDQWDRHGADFIRASLGHLTDEPTTDSYKPGTLVPEISMCLGKDADGQDVHVTIGEAHKTPKDILEQISVADLHAFLNYYDSEELIEECEDAVEELKGLMAAGEEETVYAIMLKDLIKLYNKRDSDVLFIEGIIRARNPVTETLELNLTAEQNSSESKQSGTKAA